jgi:HPt (histidine-containing phosphotransfer) domain-containing protein
MHPHQARSQLARGKHDGRVQIEVHRRHGGAALLGFEQAVEVAIGSAGVA